MTRSFHSGKHFLIQCAFILLPALQLEQHVLAWSSCTTHHVYGSRRGGPSSMSLSQLAAQLPSMEDDNKQIILPSSAIISNESSRSQRQKQQQSTIVDNRRNVIQQMLLQSAVTAAFTTFTSIITPIQPAQAYTPDKDPLRESLYLMSRVQEATVQQERFVNKATQQDVLKNKMKLTLRLVEKNYRLLDQITYASEYVVPASKVVEATTAGYEAAEALQNAIDYVNSDLKVGEFEKGQKEYLISNLGECRERLFDFLSYMPQDRLEGARKRVEEENVANRDEFDGDSDAGVYNPVVLPWKNR